MKKSSVLNILLYVLPLLVVYIALNPSGVLVFDGVNTTYCSWFQLVEGSVVGWCAPVSGLLCYVLFALAVIYGLTKKTWCLKGIRNVAFLAGCIAVVPNLVTADIMGVPNAFGAIILLVNAAIAFTMLKKTAVEESKPLTKRLKK